MKSRKTVKLLLYRLGDEIMKQWEGFKKGSWTEEINVRDFIQLNYSPYEGNEDFLAEPTERTKSLWKKTEDLIKKEILNKEVEICTRAFSGIANHEPGYLDRENELIVGYQTDKPLKRLVNPYGGYRMVRNSLDAYGAEMDDTLEKHFNEFRKTHNQGVFDAYTEEMRKARTVGLLTGLPDAYGRGRIIGDYRRIPLYGIDFLKAEKIKDKKNIKGPATEEIIRLREEVSEQIAALDEIKKMAASYGFDISQPAKNAREAVQFLYFGYLAAIKENNGAAMSLGRNTTFLDII